MSDRGRSPCDVCESRQAAAGELQCRHGFCEDCFVRFVRGSVDELTVALRCCICGMNSPLVREIEPAPALHAFGRAAGPVLSRPVGLTVGLGGEFITADRHQQRVWVTDPAGNLVHDFPYTHGTQLLSGISVGGSGEVAIACTDGVHRFVSFFLTTGEFVGSAYLPGGRDEAGGVSGVAAHQDGWVAVSDTDQTAIHVINKHKRHSKKIALLPIQYETAPVPSAVAVGRNSNNIVMADSANHCIKVYDVTGEFKFKFGSHGERPGQFKSPSGVAVNKDGVIVVADRGNNRVQLFAADGKFIRYVICFSQGNDVYMAAYGVAFLSNDHVAVMLTGTRDCQVAEIRVYQ